MPYISTRTNVEISAEKEKRLKSMLGEAIGSFPGKTEAWLMTEFQDRCRLWFAGSDAPAAFAEVKVLGGVKREHCEKMTACLCKIFESELGIPADRVYVKYEPVENWGWNGSDF